MKMHLKQDYQFRTLWDVIGRVRGSSFPTSGSWPEIIVMRGSTVRLIPIAVRRRCSKPFTGSASC